MSTTGARAWGWHSAATLLGALAMAGVPGATPAQAQTASPYASLENLPDWSGWWGHGDAAPDEVRRQPPPIRPEILAAAQAAGGTDADPLRYCRPMQFTGSNGGFTEAVEFLFTPGRVTLTNERGLIRRIYTDGRPMPTGVNPTNTGWSTGRWEGQTLVVETTGINPLAPYPGAAGAAIGPNVRISERIYLEDPHTLKIDVETVAPELLTKPDRRTRVYTRLPKTTASEVTFCTEYDRSIEPGSGVQRFDLTPPPDLPPPPQ
jgi:hypothetical protein